MRTNDLQSPSPWRGWHLAVAFLLGAGVSLIVARSFGYFESQHHAMEEARLCYQALSTPKVSVHLQPQIREYLKGRLYWNAAMWIGSSAEVDEWHINFGPVDTSLLQGVAFDKDSVNGEEIYRAALARHPHAATSIYTW